MVGLPLTDTTDIRAEILTTNVEKEVPRRKEEKEITSTASTNLF